MSCLQFGQLGPCFYELAFEGVDLRLVGVTSGLSFAVRFPTLVDVGDLRRP